MILLASSFFLRNDPKQFERMKPYPPLATLLIAAALRERGHDVALFDATLASGVDEFVAMLQTVRPSVVGILEDNFNYLTKMCTVRSREATLAMVAAARRQGCRVAVNGSDATDLPAHYFDAGADAVLPREADVSFPALAAAWRDSHDAVLTGIPGLALRDTHGTVTYTASALSPSDLDALPLPAWDLIDVARYRRAWTDAHGHFSWNMVTSRGCPFGCNWCAKPIFGRRYTQRSPEGVAEELRALKRDVHPDHVWFADDIFGLSASWIDAFATAVAERQAQTPFMIQCRADLLRPPVVAALASAGADEVWIGVESGSQSILDAMDKGTTVDEVRAATRTLRGAGIKVGWFLQLGYPSERWDDLLLTRDLVRNERPDDIGVSVSYPLPGTPFHARVRAELGAKHNWDDSGELAMLFRGTYTTGFYGRVRDVLHDEVRRGRPDHERWAALERDESACRTGDPLTAAGS
jgi:anaerobic magnesium-protoporphyrin IX monomethyl ester cyclase